MGRLWVKTVWLFVALFTFWGLARPPAFAAGSITCPTYGAIVFNLSPEEAQANNDRAIVLPVGADELQVPIGSPPEGGRGPQNYDPANGWRGFDDGYGGVMWEKVYPRGTVPKEVAFAPPIYPSNPYRMGGLPMNTVETERDFAGEFGPSIFQPPGQPQSCSGSTNVALDIRAPGVYAVRLTFKSGPPEYLQIYHKVLLDAFKPKYPVSACPWKLSQWEYAKPPFGDLVYMSFGDDKVENFAKKYIYKSEYNIEPISENYIDEIFWISKTAPRLLNIHQSGTANRLDA